MPEERRLPGPAPSTSRARPETHDEPSTPASGGVRRDMDCPGVGPECRGRARGVSPVEVNDFPFVGEFPGFTRMNRNHNDLG